MHTFGIYRRGLRHLAKRLKEGKPSAIRRTAELMAGALPAAALVVPMPSHGGRATVMLAVAREIGTIRRDVRVLDALEAIPHGGMYSAKKKGITPPHPVMRKICEVPDGAAVCVIDNVIDTGATFYAASAALHGAELFAVAHTTNENKKETGQ